VGGGPTGVELAGALGEIANDTLRSDFRSIHPEDARIELIEALDRVLPTYPADRSASAKQQLERLGVTVRTGTRVTEIGEAFVRVEDERGSEEIRTRTVLWAAGVLAASFGRAVAEAVDAETDRSGRILVGPDLTVPGHPEIIVVGDAAVQPWKEGRPVPGVAQGGIQGGKYAGRLVVARLRDESIKPFHYQDRGDVAVIGRLRGVTNIGWMGPFGRQGGFVAWALWLGIHLVYLIGFANRIVVTVRWAWSFLTRGRSTRLITGAPQVLPIERPEPPEPPE
jgi:NADH dehydrogenase